MIRHLNDQELASATAGFPLAPEQQAHLEGCISCRRSVDHFLDQVNERRRSIGREAPDWDAQTKKIVDALPLTQVTHINSRRRWLTPLLAAAATITIVVGIGLIVQRTGPASISSSRSEIEIEEILAQADSLLADEGIPGFDMFDDMTDDDLTALFEAKNS
ncbi:MAG: hypothetical protein DRJ65_04080 [Acidobacteria bacterium]|nr:MAG: hypothetical protein DRJ65_04080 [Acidobacteriota bacterium]